jgi:hypothetical protein
MWWRYQVGDVFKWCQKHRRSNLLDQGSPYGILWVLCGSKLINLAIHACHFHTMYCELFKFGYMWFYMWLCSASQANQTKKSKKESAKLQTGQRRISERQWPDGFELSQCQYLVGCFYLDATRQVSPAGSWVFTCGWHWISNHQGSESEESEKRVKTEKSD